MRITKKINKWKYPFLHVVEYKIFKVIKNHSEWSRIEMLIKPRTFQQMLKERKLQRRKMNEDIHFFISLNIKYSKWSRIIKWKYKIFREDKLKISRAWLMIKVFEIILESKIQGKLKDREIMCSKNNIWDEEKAWLFIGNLIFSLTVG